MANDLIRMLLQAELDKESISKIQAQLKNIEKNSKPIEIEVITDKAEIAMSNFAKSMGIKLNKDLKGQFKDLSSTLLGDFDQSKFDNLAKGIVNAYKMAMDKNSKKIQFDFFENSDDKKIYDYLKGSILKLDDSTINAKKNVDGFNGALKGLVKTSKESGLSLDQMAQELNSMGIKDLGVNTEDIASKLTKSVKNVRDVKNGFIELGDSVPDKEINGFVQNELMDLLTGLGKIEYESKQAKDSLKQINSVQDEFTKTNTAIDSIETNIKGLGVVNRKTFKDMNDDVYKYIDTYKNLEKGINISDTYAKNDQGGFDFTGRIIDDKSVEVTYKALQNAHGEAIKLNNAFDNTIVKNKQMASDASWKQYFQGISETSREIQQLNQYYSQLADGGMEQAEQQAIKLNNEFDKLEQVTKNNLLLDTDKMSNRYKNLISGDDITNIKSMINSLKFDDPNLGKNIDLIKLKMKEVSTGAEHSRKSLDLANKSSMSFGEAMKQAAYKFGIWSAITASYYKVIREISTGIKFITEMDTALTEIGIVTGQTREQTAGLSKEYNNLAKELKVTTNQVTSAAVEFYRQGLSQEEVMDRLRTTTMYSKIANLEFAQSAEILTATVNSMGVDIERAADVFTYLGDATATGADEIGIGFSKTGGAAAALGVEFEKVASWIAVISSKTRESSESIGFSLNTILSRMSRITTTGFNEDDDTKLNDVAEALNEIGIALTDSEGDFRNFGTIIDEVGSVFETLTDRQKAYVANTLAGTRQQSRFYNLMNGYTESLKLYEGALASTNTTQEKFNIYLESNQATLDKFRTTMEGLWITIIDSDSLMGIVKTATSFIETLDSMVQSFGAIGSALTLIIPFIGIKLAWAFRTAYVEIVKLIATGASKEVLAMGGLFNKWAISLVGVGTASKGAAIGMTGLTIATAGLTLGISALVAGVMWLANESKKAKQAFADALDNSQQLNEEVQSLESLAQKQKELTEIENKSVAQKEELLKVQRELAKLYPQLATGIDGEGNKIADNIEATKQLTEEKRKLLEQELLVIKTTADQKLPQLRKELADMQEEADGIQKRLNSGDTTETRSSNGITYQVDVTQELRDRLLELVNAQRENYDETIKLENGVKSYNQILEDNAERQKWATVEELHNQATKAKTIEQLMDIEKKLKDLGFTSDDISNILGGNIDFVKGKYAELDIQQIINLQTIETLDATQKQTWINYLNNSKTATIQLINDTKARIKAIMAEAQALAALTGGKVKSVSVVSKKGEIDPKTGLLSNLSNVAQNQAIDAQRELVNLESNLKEIEKALNNVSNIDTKQVSGNKSTSKTGSSSSPSSAGSSSSSADSRQFLESIDAEIRAIKLKNDALLSTEESLKEQLSLAKDIEGMEGLNEQYRVTGELIEHNKVMLESFKKEQELISARASSLRSANSKYDTTTWFDSNAEQTTAYIDKYNKATKDQQEEMSTLFSQIQSLKKAWMESATEVDGIVASTKELTLVQEDLLKQQRELERTKWIEQQNDLYDEQQERLQALESIQEKIVEIIRKRGEEEKKALDEAYNKDMKQLDERHNARKEKWAEELDEFKALIQGKLDALNDQFEQEDYLEQLNKEREEANRLQSEIDVLSLDDSLTARNQTIELRKQLAAQNEKIAKLQQDKERDLLKQSLEDQLKNYEQDAKDKEDIADTSYENEKRRLEEDYDINKQFLDKKYSDEKVYEEARKSIMRGTVETSKGMFEDIYDAFEDFEDKFGKGMGILGEIIKKDFLDQLDLAKKSIEELDYKTDNQRPKYDSDYQPTDEELGSSSGSSDGSGGGIYMSKSDFDKYVAFKQVWEMANKTGNTESKRLAKEGADALRLKYKITSDKYSYDDLKNLTYDRAKFMNGGKLTQTGTGMIDIHGSKNSPEWILNDSQLKTILQNSILSTMKIFTPKIPNIAGGSGNVFNFDNLVNVEGNVTKETIPLIKAAGNDIIETIKELNKSGIFRSPRR